MQSHVDLVLSGSGTNATCLQGAVAGLQESGYKIKRVAGTSGGSIIAAALAYGLTDKQMTEISNKLFGGDLLDPSVLALRRGGLHRGNVIHKLLREYFPGSMNGEFALPWGAFACNLNSRLPFFFSSAPVIVDRQRASDLVAMSLPVPVADVIRASISIPFFFAAAKIKGMKSFWSDGGVRMNLGMGVWDDIPERLTVGVRFKSTAGEAEPIYGTTGVVKANLAMLLENIGHTFVSQKRYSAIIDIETDSDSLDFSKSPAEVRRMYDAGFQAAMDWARGRR